ncbi:MULTISPECIES: helix-turn-helix transcriptional regulator [Tatumella]|mgnify:CR=1 FL=1|uniref:Helix-turn-helix transcriptional regulator n=1 Tax=Tatumella punctata TaxID=399969 RepID=A0ABW1VSK9_9GAMM
MTIITRQATLSSPERNSRQLLATFLRTRRESLDPQRLGLPRSGRRRTPGLRREEVAMLADVGVTWYTWLEQGRQMKPSAAVLASVSQALQCTPAETRYLFILAGLPVPGEPPSSVCQQAGPASQRLLRSLMPNPAALERPNFDLIGYNQSFCRLMGVDLDQVPPEDRNCIYQYLTSAEWRSRFCGEDKVLPVFVAYFRAGMAEYRGDPRWDTLLERFFTVSPRFHELWNQHYEIRSIENHIKNFNHPQLGTITLQQMNWYSAPRDGSRLLVYLPLDASGEKTVAALAAGPQAGQSPHDRE